ncbi:hypothetical protein ABKN59_010409 [Abortiporus biennis]
MVRGYHQTDNLVNLFNTFLHQGPYPALLVVSVCARPVPFVRNWNDEFIGRIEVSSDSALRHFIEAVSKTAAHLVACRNFEPRNDGTSPPLLLNPSHEKFGRVYFYVPDHFAYLWFFTFTILARVDEFLIKLHSDILLDMQNTFVEAGKQLPPPFFASPSHEEALRKALDSWKNKAPSSAHQEVTEKLCTLLVNEIRGGGRLTGNDSSIPLWGWVAMNMAQKRLVV